MSGSHLGKQEHSGSGQSAAADPSMEDILASIRRILSEEDAPAAEPEPPSAAPLSSALDKPDILLLDETMLVPELHPPHPEPHAAALPAMDPLADDDTMFAPPPAPDVPVHPEIFAAAPPAAIQPAPVLMPVPHANPADPATPARPFPEISATPEPPPVFAPIAPLPLAQIDTGTAFPHMTTETTSMSGSTPASLGQAPNSSPSTGLASVETTAAAAGAVSNLVRALTSDRNAQVHSGGPTIADLVREEMRPMVKAWLDSNLPPLVERLVRAEIERVIARAAI